MNIGLPENWKVKNLGDLVEKQTIKARPQDFPDAKFIGMDCIEPHTMRPTFLYDFKEFKSAGNYFEAGQVLYGRMRPYLNKVYKADFNGACSGEFIVLECTKSFSPDLLRYILHSRGFVRFVNEKTSGDRPRVSFDEISDYPILLPPIDEQERIVAKIEELFSELDTGVESLKKAQAQLKTYRQAVLKAAFEGKLTNENIIDGELPNGWSLTKIVDLAKSEKHALKAGPFGSSLKKEFYVESGYKIYGQEQVINGNLFFGDYYISDEKYEELKSNRIQPGDVLISLVGTVGKVLVLPENAVPGIINPRLIKISLNRDIYLPSFFKYYFESSTVKSFYGSKAQGTTMDVLNLGIIKTIPFPLCSIDEQQRIVEEIESRLSVCDKLEETIAASLKQSEALRQSILKQAFEGKLIQ